MTDERSERHRLADALEGLGADQTEAVAAVVRYGERTRRLMWITGAIAVVTALVVIALVVVTVLVKGNSDDIGRVQQRTGEKVLCPLYGAFLAAENNPPPLSIKDNPAQMAERARAFKIIHEGAAQLDCDKR